MEVFAVDAAEAADEGKPAAVETQGPASPSDANGYFQLWALLLGVMPLKALAIQVRVRRNISYGMRVSVVSQELCSPGFASVCWGSCL